MSAIPRNGTEEGRRLSSSGSTGRSSRLASTKLTGIDNELDRAAIAPYPGAPPDTRFLEKHGAQQCGSRCGMLASDARVMSR